MGCGFRLDSIGWCCTTHQLKEMSQMLTITTPTTVRPIPEEATNQRHGRTPGAVGVLLDPETIAAQVRVMYPEIEADSIRADWMLLLQSPHGEVAVIGTEGVGTKVPIDQITIPVYVSIGWSYELIDIPATVIEEAMTTEGADVAGHIRIFGDRLDGNAYTWRRFVTGGTF
jgi:hypothetical protein